jgi:hypothetical protein
VILLPLRRVLSYRARAAARLQRIQDLEAALLAANEARAIADRRLVQYVAGGVAPGEYGDIVLTGWAQPALPTHRIRGTFLPVQE